MVFADYRLRAMGVLIVCMFLAACAGERAPSVTTEPIGTVTLRPSPVATSTTTTPEATPDDPLTLTIWWPEPLSPTSNSDAAFVLAEQVDAFQASQSGVGVTYRLKKAEDVGGIMETLRAASVVAPGALPDLTLLRREDLLAAVQAGLIQPLEGRVSTAILGDLYSSALRLGQVNGQLYGLPYTLEVLHTVYRPLAQDISLAQLEAVLTAARPFVFPAEQTEGIDDVLLLQYLAAGGTLTEGHLGTLNTDALRSVLTFYEQAVQEGVVSPAILEYASTKDYGLSSMTNAIMVVTSTDYLGMLNQEANLSFGPVPVSSGQPSTVLDGWMWVLTTANSDRQALAMRFLNWMFNADRQAVYVQTVHMLPAQRAALRQAYGNRPYIEFVNMLLANTVLPLSDSGGGSAARAMQNALAAVIRGQRTAEEATQDVVDQLTG